MLEHKLLSVVAQLAQVMVNGFVVAVYNSVEGGVLDVKPCGVVMLHDTCRCADIKHNGNIRRLHLTVNVFGQVDTAVSVRLGYVPLFASCKECCNRYRGKYQACSRAMR